MKNMGRAGVEELRVVVRGVVMPERVFQVATGFE
jgi:hypothetical protein